MCVSFFFIVFLLDCHPSSLILSISYTYILRHGTVSISFFVHLFFLIAEMEGWNGWQKILYYLKNNNASSFLSQFSSQKFFNETKREREREFTHPLYKFPKAEPYHFGGASIRGPLSIIVQVSQRVNISSRLKFHLVRSGRMEQSFHDSLLDWPSFLRSFQLAGNQWATSVPALWRENDKVSTLRRKLRGASGVPPPRKAPHVIYSVTLSEWLSDMLCRSHAHPLCPL